MNVLVTGGTGVVGRAAISELLQRGHTVRLFTRGAEDDASSWDGPVEPWPGDVADVQSVTGAADGCDAVIHIAGIIAEDAPDVTFRGVNIEGTANVLAEAERAGVRRLIHVSSLGADRGESDYHRSKLAGEEVVRQFDGEWCIARTGAVVGPGDETVSIVLRMVRPLPAVPVIGDGDQPFQPVWHEDVGWALAECLERDDVVGRTLNIAGTDVLSMRELIDLFAEVTDRDPVRVPVPEFVASVGSTLAGAVGFHTPVSAATVQMLIEGNIIRDGETNDLTGLLGREPAAIRERLVQLVDDMPEQTPDEGVGKLKRRRFQVDIQGATLAAGALMHGIRARFSDIVPFDAAAEPGAPTSIEEGATLTLSLPGRGHVQLRVEQISDTSFTLATLEGHPLAGVVRFRTSDRDGDVVRFTIDVIERAASRLDQLSMMLVGTAAQGRTWTSTAEAVVEESGGTAPDGVDEESWQLDDDEAEPLEDWIEELVQRRQRNDVA
ncbi:hypothetical protein BH23GEM10_BH23GEM10_04930 [soil metagenome]